MSSPRTPSKAMELGRFDQMDLKNTPASMLEESASVAGLLSKEGTKGTSRVAKALMEDIEAATSQSDIFKQRWFVLWRHPDRSQGAFSLLWYESQSSKKPKGFAELVRGQTAISNPKRNRPGHDYVFTIKITKDDGEKESFVLSAPDMDTKIVWVNMLEKHCAENEYVDNEDISRHGGLPTPKFFQGDFMPAPLLESTALMCGWLFKQGKAGSKSFKKVHYVAIV
eukprot:SAG31_NODE_777_length_12167_cov_6.570683_1_plen_225_part_00